MREPTSKRKGRERKGEKGRSGKEWEGGREKGEGRACLSSKKNLVTALPSVAFSDRNSQE